MFGLLKSLINVLRYSSDLLTLINGKTGSPVSTKGYSTSPFCGLKFNGKSLGIVGSLKII